MLLASFFLRASSSSGLLDPFFSWNFNLLPFFGVFESFEFISPPTQKLSLHHFFSLALNE